MQKAIIRPLMLQVPSGLADRRAP